MDREFWLERWQQQQIAFHQGHPHPLLVKHGALLSAERVLVPLCGKAVDLAFLAQHGHSVLGVELSELAVRAFFEEQALEATESVLGPFKRFVSGAIEILCGDFFALEPAHARAGALYDRAALIALPEPMRARYAAHVARLMPPGAPGLLITLEYAAPTASGPPFSVGSTEVHALYEPSFAVRELERSDILDSEPRFKERGMTTLYEAAYALERNAS